MAFAIANLVQRVAVVSQERAASKLNLEFSQENAASKLNLGFCIQPVSRTLEHRFKSVRISCKCMA